jgi:multiple sugar transport system permease protein
VIALILAVFLNKKLKGTSAFRTIFFLPMVCAPAAVAMVWKWLYNQQFGLINNIFGTDVAWISDPKIAWISIGIIGVWSIIGYNMVLFISGLQEIPGDYYEAAEIDGATGIRQFFHITVHDHLVDSVQRVFIVTLMLLTVQCLHDECCPG